MIRNLPSTVLLRDENDLKKSPLIMYSSIFSHFIDSVATDVKLMNNLKKAHNPLHLKADIADETERT